MAECLAIQDNTTGLWLVSINSDGTYSWGNGSNAICFETDAAAQTVLDTLNAGGGDTYRVGRPKTPPHH